MKQGVVLPKLSVTLAVVVVTVVGGYLALRISLATSPTSSVQIEAGTVATPAGTVIDSTASGGSAVQFKTNATTDPTIALAGDIACAPSNPQFNSGNGTATACGEGTTAKGIVAAKPTAVIALGDTQYVSGALSDYKGSYDISWGKFKSITYPVIGNHEYGTSGASGYFNYFGDKATPLQPGCRSNCNAYYSFTIGAWHFIALNSECNNVPGGCATGSPQEKWLAADLAANKAKCTAALWHEPYWAMGPTLRTDLVLPLIQDLYAANADLILNGHDHTYVRWAPQDPLGNLDTARGIREFIVGSGGAEFTGIGANHKNVQVYQNNTFGFLSLTLHAAGYDWKFNPTGGSGSFSDSGTGTCH
jgi:hypothetical protein